MGKKGRILWAASVAAVVAVVVWLCRPPAEPACLGKPLSYWLAGYNPADFKVDPPRFPSSPSRANADAAIQNMGTNVIPILLQMLREPSPTLANRLWAMAEKQHFIKIPLLPADGNRKAFHGLMALGAKASNAVPRLLAILEADPSPFLQQAVPAILGRIGPASSTAIPSLLRLIADTNALVRNNAIFALGQIRAEPKLVVPALTKCLNDSEAMVRAEAAIALGEFSTEARSAVPALLALRGKEALNTNAGAGMRIGVGLAFDPSMNTFAAWPKPDVVPSIMDALQRIGPAANAEPSAK
jgi:HEAT repeats